MLVIERENQSMALVIELHEKKEAALKAKAQVRWVSVEEYAKQVLDRDLEEATDSNSALAQRDGVAERIRALRDRLRPDPEGWTTRDYVERGYR